MSDAAEIWVCPQCGTSLDVSDLGFYARVICPECQHEDRVHTLIANFRIEGVLGVGGMSVVLRGRDILLNRVVAIKLLNDTYKGEDARIARFERECALMARVRHSNVVSIYSAGWEKGQFYIAMEEVPGLNLEELLTDGFCMEQNRAIEIISEVALGLDAASQAGLLHRDMKPGNIILSESGKAKVLDFGLSLQSTDSDDEEMIWATPFYVPPETLRREPEDVRADIYALGMTLRHLLTGNDQYPYESHTADDLLYCKEHLVPICQENRQIASDLGKLVDHMTAFSVDERPASYVELLKAIGATLEKVQKKKRVSEYLRSRSFAVKAISAVCCLIAGYCLGASLCHTVFAPKSSICRELPSKHMDASRFTALCQHVAKQNWAEAYKSSIHLSRNAADPDLSAWASFYAWTLCSLNSDLAYKMPEAKAQLQDLFSKLGDDDFPTMPLHDDLMYLKPLLASKESFRTVPDALVLSHPIVDAMQLVYLAEILKTLGQADSAADYLLQARLFFEQSIPPFDRMRDLFPDAEVSDFDAAPFVADAEIEKTQNDSSSTKSIDFADDFDDDFTFEIDDDSRGASSTASPMLQSFEELFNTTQYLTSVEELDESQLAKNKAIMQICRAAIAMVAFYERKSPNPSWDGLTPDACLTRATELSQTRYQQELCEFKCMCLLIKGQYDDARDTMLLMPNNDKKSAFSVLMAHWLEVLDS